MKRSFNWVYRPGISDIVDPLVRRGSPIAQGSRVRIAREEHPVSPRGWSRVFVVIQDQQGNLQTVWKRALTRA